MLKRISVKAPTSLTYDRMLERPKQLGGKVSASRSQQGQQHIALLDIYRILAALSVMFFHLTFNGLRNGKLNAAIDFAPLSHWTEYGNFGVQFFFLISGLVIFLTPSDSAGTFMRKRLVRLYPAFWAAVTLTSIFAFFLGGQKMSVSIPQYLANLTMFPRTFGYGYVDGVYWTLKYEMQFYACVFLVYLFGAAQWRDKILMLTAALIAIGLLLKSGFKIRIPFDLYNYSFFLGGALIAIVQRQGYSLIPSLLIIALCVLSSLSARSATIVACLYAAMLLLTIPRIANLKILGSRLMGALTYPIYLVHAHIGYMVMSAIAGPNRPYTALCLTVALILCLALAIHFLIERRMRHFWVNWCEKLFEVPITRLQLRLTMRRPAMTSGH